MTPALHSRSTPDATQADGACRRRQRAWRRLLVATILLLAASAWLGCMPERKYRVLSFFFDGVPNPNAALTAAGTPADTSIGLRGAVPATFSIHRPYADNKCDACHVGEQSPESTPRNNVCISCHQKELNRFPAMHGPVAVGECLLCHSPHDSPLPKLVRAAAPTLCTQCHEAGLLSLAVPQHSDPNNNCLECHAGHGGDHPPFLRVAIAAPGGATHPPPATQPGPGGGKP